jgi:hypothetical protein
MTIISLYCFPSFSIGHSNNIVTLQGMYLCNSVLYCIVLYCIVLYFRYTAYLKNKNIIMDKILTKYLSLMNTPL